MSNETTDSLQVLVAVRQPSTNSQGEMGIFGSSDESIGIKAIAADTIREGLQEAIKTLRGIFDSVAESPGALDLREAQVQFEITASGGLALLGTTAQTGSKGGITLTFKR